MFTYTPLLLLYTLMLIKFVNILFKAGTYQLCICFLQKKWRLKCKKFPGFTITQAYFWHFGFGYTAVMYWMLQEELKLQSNGRLKIYPKTTLQFLL
jgi:hypothetical protein